MIPFNLCVGLEKDCVIHRAGNEASLTYALTYALQERGVYTLKMCISETPAALTEQQYF